MNNVLVCNSFWRFLGVAWASASEATTKASATQAKISEANTLVTND